MNIPTADHFMTCQRITSYYMTHITYHIKVAQTVSFLQLLRPVRLPIVDWGLFELWAPVLEQEPAGWQLGAHQLVHHPTSASASALASAPPHRAPARAPPHRLLTCSLQEIPGGPHPSSFQVAKILTIFFSDTP